MSEPNLSPGGDPVVLDASLGALSRVTQLREQLGETAHRADHTMESLANELVELVMGQQFPATESREVLASYRGALADDGRFAGVLAVENALDVLQKELRWYQQLLVLAASFASIAERLPEERLQERLLLRARQTLENVATA